MPKNEGRLFEEFSPVTYDEWKEAAEKLLKGRPFDKVMKTKTPEGITLEPIYLKEDLFRVKHIDVLPGYAPYVRGTKIVTDQDNPWIVAQQIYEPTPKEFNETLIHDLYRGQTALSFLIDENTQKGIDADSDEAENTGYRGLSLSTLDDVSKSFHDVVLEVLPYHVNVGANPTALSALLFAHAKEAQELKNVHGVIGFDPIGYAATKGKLEYSLEELYDQMAQIIEYKKQNNMDVRTILVEGHPYHNGGADSVSEISYVLATLVEYIEAMLERGLDIKDISKSTAISLSVGSHFFMEIAKLRAVKMLYANVLKAYGADEEAQKIYLHAKTSSWNQTVYDPYVNMLRGASEAFSAAVGVVDSLSVLPFDETVRAATTFSRRIARNLQYILLDEIHVNQPLDPAGGSWYVENLTEQIAERSWKRFQELSSEGKMSDILASGAPKEQVAQKYEERFKDVAKRKAVYVGVNQYANMTEIKIEKEDTDYEKIAKARKESVAAYKKARAQSAEEILKAFKAEPTIAHAVDAVCAGATLGELTEVLKAASSQPYEAVAIHAIRGAKRIEDLRDESAELKAKGEEVKVFSTNIGKLSVFKPRADFSRGFFEVGGFTVIGSDGFEDPKEAAQAALDSGADVAIICSSDAVYPEVVPTIAKTIKEANKDMLVVLAGRAPEDLKAIYDEAGVDEYIYMGANNYDLLKEIQEGVKR